MKKTYQQPTIEITAIVPTQVIAATVTNIIGMSGSETIFCYGGGGSDPARAGENHLWDDEDDDTDWDQL